MSPERHGCACRVWLSAMGARPYGRPPAPLLEGDAERCADVDGLWASRASACLDVASDAMRFIIACTSLLFGRWPRARCLGPVRNSPRLLFQHKLVYSLVWDWTPVR